jgi:hypothetical protein
MEWEVERHKSKDKALKYAEEEITRMHWDNILGFFNKEEK